MKKLPIILSILIIVGIGGGFFGGLKYQENKDRSATGNRRGAFTGRMNGPTTGQNLRPYRGEILSQDDKSITIKLQDGSSKIILLNDKTTINKTALAVKSDLQIGSTVAIFGSDNSDGSITAQNVSLNPTQAFGATPPTR